MISAYGITGNNPCFCAFLNKIWKKKTQHVLFNYYYSCNTVATLAPTIIILWYSIAYDNCLVNAAKNFNTSATLVKRYKLIVELW